MDVVLHRLDPNIPDPVESRRSAAGTFVRIVYATIVFGMLAFFVIYFGRPLVYLGGPGTVSSPRHVVSLPYIVQVSEISVMRGATVAAGDVIGRVRSPQHDETVATYMRALADVASRRADLRIKARVAQESLEVARSYLQLAEEGVNRVETSSAASLNYRVEMFRERAIARKAVVSQEAEIAESAIQLASLDEFARKIGDHLEKVEGNFADGRIVAPIAGIISSTLARVGQSLVAGTPIAEVLDSSDVFVAWYVPNERLVDPKVGKAVFVLFGNQRISGRITEILPLSEVYPGTSASVVHERAATQVARIRVDPGETPPPLNSTVYVHMHYTDFSFWFSKMLLPLVGLR